MHGGHGPPRVLISHGRHGGAASLKRRRVGPHAFPATEPKRAVVEVVAAHWGAVKAAPVPVGVAAATVVETATGWAVPVSGGRAVPVAATSAAGRKLES